MTGTGVTDATVTGASAWRSLYARTPTPENFFPEGFVTRVFRSTSPVRFLHDEPAGRRVLDLGCGHGRNVPFLLSLGSDLTGLEVSPLLVDQLTRTFPTARFVTGTAAHLPLPDDVFDVVLACNSIYYLDADAPELGHHLAECARVLRPGGTLVVSLLGERHSLLARADEGPNGTVRIHGDHLGARDGVLVRPFRDGDDQALLRPFEVVRHGEIVERVDDDVRHLDYFVATAP